jgi:hypothetical protein
MSKYLIEYANLFSGSLAGPYKSYVMLSAIIHIAVLVSVTKHHVYVSGHAGKQITKSSFSLDNQVIY